MRIGIDIREVQPFPTGLGRYFSGLIYGLLSLDTPHEWVLLGRHGNPLFERNYPHNWELVETFSASKSFLQYFTFPHEVNRLGLDLLITNPYGFSPFIKTAYALIILDLLYHHFPQQADYKVKLYQNFLEERAAMGAKFIITISRFCARDISRRLGVAEKRIAVTPLGVSPSLSQYKIATAYKSDQVPGNPFFLYVGNSRPHKNLGVLLEAFSRWDRRNVNLVVVGSDIHSRYRELERLKNLAKQKNLGDRLIFKKGVSDRELADLYQHAVALLQPSIFEGFGLPILEALLLGCPVICSDIPVFHEVAGPCAVYADPCCPGDWAKKFEEVVQWPYELRNTIIRGGRKRSSIFRWEQVASTLLRHIG